MKKTVKIIIIGFLSGFFHLFGQKKDEKNAIFIFGFPRSGSTWLMNILGSINGAAMLFEPFNPYQDKRFKPYTYRHKIYPYLVRKKEEKFSILIKRLLTGTLISWWSLSHEKFKRFIKSNLLVVKILRANFIFDWFEENYPNNKKIILLRHPCAVINSMKRSPGGWHSLKKSTLLKMNELSEQNYNLDFINDCQTKEELYMVFWCIENAHLLNQKINKNTLIVFYENLFLNAEAELSKIFNFLDVELNNDVIAAYKKISKTTNADNSLKADEPLKKWQKEFDEEELSSFQNILNTFSVNAYNVKNYKPI